MRFKWLRCQCWKISGTKFSVRTERSEIRTRKYGPNIFQPGSSNRLIKALFYDLFRNIIYIILNFYTVFWTCLTMELVVSTLTTFAYSPCWWFRRSLHLHILRVGGFDAHYICIFSVYDRKFFFQLFSKVLLKQTSSNMQTLTVHFSGVCIRKEAPPLLFISKARRSNTPSKIQPLRTDHESIKTTQLPVRWAIFSNATSGVVYLPPNLKFMVLAFLNLTQCIITDKAARRCSVPDKNMQLGIFILCVF